MATSSEVFERNTTGMKDQEVVQRLIELFGNVLDLEIIQSVAFNCNYQMDTTSEILLEMSSSIGAVQKQPKQSKKQKSNETKCINSYASAAYNQQPKDNNNADVIIVSERVLNCTPNKIDTNLYAVPTPKRAQNSASPQRKSKKEQEFSRIILHVRQGTRILILMRGLPGSGKSYLAKQIVDQGIERCDYSTFILSADDYFINCKTGLYEYDVLKLSDAHNWNQKRAYKNMSGGMSPVVIDNTNLQAWEMKPYLAMAVNFGYRIEIVEPFTHWALNDKECARKNSHGVPRAKIKEMCDRYEKNLTVQKLLCMFNLSYTSNYAPPVNRNYPPIVHNFAQCNGLSNSALPLLHNGNNGADFHIINENKNVQAPKVRETVDLMDFESDIASASKYIPNKRSSSEEQQNVNPLDSILSDVQTNNFDVLKPNVWNSPEKRNLLLLEPGMKKARTSSLNFATQTSSEEVTVPEEPQAQEDPSSFSDTKLAQAQADRNTQINKARNLYPKLDLSSWGLTENAMSNWESWDVVSPLKCSRELESANSEQSSSSSSALVQTSDSMTNTSSADFAFITKEHSSTTQNIKILRTKNRDINEGIVITPPMSPPKKTLLDKSSMTNGDVLSAALNRERDASEEKQIKELVSLFPDIPVDYLRDVYEKCKKDLNWAVDLLLDDNKEFLPSLASNHQSEESSSNLGENERNSEIIEANMEELTINNIKVAETLSDQKNKMPSEEVKELKRHLEENVEINKDYYSEHILKIKNQRHGIAKPQTDKPSTSSNFEGYYFTPVDKVTTIDSDTELDNFDFPDSEEEEEIIELNLGEDVVSQLETKFGFPEMFPQGFLPIVHVPVSLARQLHALYVESVLVQMENQNQVFETILKEDEEFAKKLQMQEEALQTTAVRKTPDLQEIMDEQVASNLYQKETEEWKKLTLDNLAARLTREKLYSAFPTVDKTLLMEILHAHDNSYKQTIEVLLASTERDKVHDPDGTILEPPITETVVNDMKIAEEEAKQNAHIPDTPKSANEYREEASGHLQKHKELLRKAQQAYQSKQFAVAQFYSDVAKTHTQLYDQANSLAASAFLQEHSQRLQNFSTLDLHYLYVKEAISALDMFIDTNIQLLQGTNKRYENLFVITGRGKRSEQGKSRIKPAVMARLRKRNIWYLELNPGLLKIRVKQESAVTSSVS